MSVEFRNVVKRYGQATAVAGVSFTVDEGALVTLLGPSGCGKTTTLRMIAGLELPSEGRILIAGRDVTTLGATERDVSMVFQSYALFPHMSVLENVSYGLRRSGRAKNQAQKQALEGLAQVGLEGYGERQPSELSGGQQQRVAVARALVLEPSVLLFDEPLSNLDARLRVSMRAEIRALQKSLGITAIYVTHDQEEAMSVSDRIALMNAGRLEQVGLPVDIYRHPVSRFAAEFMGTTNLVKATELGLAAPVWVSLRPEALRFAEEAPAGWQRLSATVAQLEMLGPLTRLDLTLANGTPIRMATLDAPNHILTAGAVVSLAFDTTRLTVVP